jgi:hypothetical protein
LGLNPRLSSYFSKDKNLKIKMGGIPTSYFKLIALLLRCVEISYGLWAFSFFLHKEIHKNNFLK